MSDIKLIIFEAKRTLSTVNRHVSVVQTRSDAARPLWRRHLQEQHKPLLCRHVQMQLKPLWCRVQTPSGAAQASVVQTRSDAAQAPWVQTPPGAAQASVVQTRSDAARPLWCRHLQEQHKPLKSKAPKEILKCGTVITMLLKRSESFDNDYFFDIEAKRTHSTV